MREHLAQQPAEEVPHVARPHPLHAVALCELAENGVYPVTKPAEEGALFGSGVSFVGGIGSQEFHTQTRQLLCGLGRMVVAVSDEKAGGELGNLLQEHAELVDVCRSHPDAVMTPAQQILTCTLKP